MQEAAASMSGPSRDTRSSYHGELRGRRYAARWAQLGTVDQLRVNVRVEGAVSGATKVHVETLDLYSPRSRAMFASRAAKLLGVTVEAVEEDLSELLVAVDHVQRQASATRDAEPAADKPTMSDAEREAALALLRAPDLMDRIAAALDAVGYVGEDSNKKLGYLIAVSRKLPEPLSAIIVSHSGAGKSGLATAIERLVSPEDVVFWSRLTPQALYYVERDFLKRKLVVIEEREGSDAADYSIRALQSKQKLVQAVPVKDPATGSIKTRTMEVEGPAAFLETTTRLHINPENASRCFELYLDESPAQTERVHIAQRASKTTEGLATHARRRAVESLHQNAQRLLQPVMVVIPYAPLLTFPTSWLRTRRDNLRLLNLIEAVAFVHQFQRPRRHDAAGVEYIEATVEDYAIAYALSASVLGLGLDELKKPVRELLVTVEEKVAELGAAQGVGATTVRFTQREVRAWSGLPHHQVKIAMHELAELEYVEVEHAARGGRSFYRLACASKHEPTISGLLTPAELFNRMSASSDARASGRSGKTAVLGPKRPLMRAVSRA